MLSLALRVAPGITASDFEEVVVGSCYKEISAAISRFDAAHLDFRCIFSSNMSDRFISFSDRLPPDEEVASDTYQIFASSRSALHGMRIFPSLGTRTVGHQVASNFWEYYRTTGCTFKHMEDGSRFDSADVTPLDCMRMYEETGGVVDGPVEMRMAWKYSDLTPRVYYARGGTVIPASQYIQPIMNRLIDMFPEVHRHNRFSPPSEPLTDSDVEVIYDYSSFTSVLDHAVDFINSMGSFYRGVLVDLIDVRDGVHTVDLGELFIQYNEGCNHYASFDVERLYRSYVDDDILVFQHTCGMLGVEGNIFVATLLHGIHSRFVFGLGRSKCVGDDARGHYNTGDGRLGNSLDLLCWQIGGIGGMHPDKLAVFESRVDPDLQAYKYIKRPFRRDNDFMVEGILITLPSLIPILPISDRFHTTIPSSTHPCRTTFKSIIRLLKTLFINGINLNTVDRDQMLLLVKHVRFLVRRIVEMDPKGEHAPLMRVDSSSRYRLPPFDLWGKVDYYDWVIDSIGYDEEFRFLKRGGGTFDECDGRIGSVMQKESSKGRSFLEKMGYYQTVELFDVASIAMVGVNEMKVYIEGEYSSVKEFTVIREIPSWYTCVPGCL